MSFRVEIARRAARDIEEKYDWLAARSEEAANRWRDALQAAVRELKDSPERFPEAPEAEWYGPELRQLTYGKKRQQYRVLFEVRGEVVYVLRVRHSVQNLLGPVDL
ncbi:MAG: type II toxin-antitoxin system RelE/ParE family toxin [Gemmataceae bacterium]